VGGLCGLVRDGANEAEAGGQGRHRARDVTRAEEDQARLTFHSLHEHLHAPAAAHPQIPGEIERHDPRSPVDQRLTEQADHRMLDCPATHRAHERAIGEQEKASARLLGRRARNLDHGGERP